MGKNAETSYPPDFILSSRIKQLSTTHIEECEDNLDKVSLGAVKEKKNPTSCLEKGQHEK